MELVPRLDPHAKPARWPVMMQWMPRDTLSWTTALQQLRRILRLLNPAEVSSSFFYSYAFIKCSMILTTFKCRWSDARRGEWRMRDRGGSLQRQSLPRGDVFSGDLKGLSGNLGSV